MSFTFDEPAFLRFLAEKSKISKFPMNITQACVQFKRETETPVSVPALVKRIERYRDRIPFMTELDFDTKVRIMFATKAPVSAGFLIELKRDADVELDDRQRIIRYEQKGGGLKLSGLRRKSADDSKTNCKQTLTERILAIVDGTGREPESDVASTSTKRARMSMGDDSTQIYYEGEDSDYALSISQEEPEEEQKPEFLIENAPGSKTEESSTRVRDLLILLRGPVASIESTLLAGLLEKMELKILKEEEESKRFAFENINIPFDACLFLLMGNAVYNCPPEQESVSLRDFLISLKSVTSHITHQSIHSYHQKLKEVIMNLAYSDKMIPVGIVCSAMETALNIIAP